MLRPQHARSELFNARRGPSGRLSLLLWAALVGGCGNDAGSQPATSRAGQGGANIAAGTSSGAAPAQEPESGGRGAAAGSTSSGAGLGGGPVAQVGGGAGEGGVTENSGGAGKNDAGSGGVGGSGGVATSGGVGGSGGVSGNGVSAPTGGGAASAGASANGGAAGSGVDACPDDPAKTEPGVCGCGASEVCARLKQTLRHRYAFDGTGAVADDGVGAADGMIVGTALTGSGSVALSGTDQFVDLPNGLISALQSATFEAWATVAAGIGTYSHIIDFGSSTAAEGSQGTGRSFLFLAPGSNASDVLRAAVSLNGSGGERIVDAPFIAAGARTHLAIVFDDAADTLLLYRDGSLKGSVSVTMQLSMIADVNNWLGRSQFASDADFRGSIHEFRIYAVALTAAELELSAALGTDPAFLRP